MLRISFRRQGAAFEGWLAELNDRAHEVRETFRDKTVRAEQAFILEGPNGPMLIYAIEAAE